MKLFSWICSWAVHIEMLNYLMPSSVFFVPSWPFRDQSTNLGPINKLFWCMMQVHRSMEQHRSHMSSRNFKYSHMQAPWESVKVTFEQYNMCWCPFWITHPDDLQTCSYKLSSGLSGRKTKLLLNYNTDKNVKRHTEMQISGILMKGKTADCWLNPECESKRTTTSPVYL